MLFQANLVQTLCVTTLSIGILTGCGGDETAERAKPENETAQQSGDQNHDHDHEDGHSHDDEHDIPLTEEEISKLKDATAKYADAIAHIQKFQQEIETETASDEPAKSHRPLDNLDVVLQRLSEAAQNSNVPEDKLPEVKETAQKLRDLFEQVHTNLDAGKDADYKTVAAEISQGIEALAAIKPAETE